MEKRKKYKQELESQIQSRAHLYEKVGRQIRRKQTNMDDREREINRSLIEKIKHDVPELMSPVVSQLKRTKRRWAAAFIKIYHQSVGIEHTARHSYRSH